MTGPPIKTFGGDNFGGNYHKEVLSVPRSLLQGSSFVCQEGPSEGTGALHLAPVQPSLCDQSDGQALCPSGRSFNQTFLPSSTGLWRSP